MRLKQGLSTLIKTATESKIKYFIQQLSTAKRIEEKLTVPIGRLETKC